MPVVDIKGVGKAQFPDDIPISDIRKFLRNKYYQDTASGESRALDPVAQTVSPYEPALSIKFGQGISDVLTDTGIISNSYGAQQIGKNLSALGEFLPGIGDATAGDEFGKAVAKGDKLGMAMAGLGVIPIAGDLAKKTLKLKFPDFKMALSENIDNIILDKIVIPKNERGLGKGTDFMNELIADADSKGKVIGLTPTEDFGGNKNKLNKFYKRFGFIENKGNNKDFTISESMIRKPKTLSMDYDSRMKRAKELGFSDLNLYHGTSADIDKFDLSKGGSTSGSPLGGLAVSVATNPDLANGFAKLAEKTHGGNANVIKLLHRANKPAKIELKDDMDAREVVGAVKDAFDSGIDSIMLKNYMNPHTKKPETVILVKDPSQLRSVNATFDKNKIKSSSLLAGLAGLGLYNIQKVDLNDNIE